ncbi:MAG: sn-glycerol-3-phosphate ABC transporter ATP-binding protein UgpC [Desulfobacteraceae bacterium]|nr:sn-glycerol-3-phosphate ABC transporter ATP-binding protein UgpC [Desulfobacteraceae bacterium]
MAGIRLENINKKFGKTEVLHQVNLEIGDGEFVVLVGPSGCGKSTLLRLVAGLEDITAGNIFIGDALMNRIEPQHRNIAMVFQNYALYPHKNVRENIIFGLKRAHAPKDVIESRLSKVVNILGLEDFLARKPAQLSGGQRQRVAMGRALVRDAKVFLFDEPLSNLDAKLRNQMRSEIRRIHREYQTTSVYVTHDQVEAMTLGERVVVIRDGYIEQQGTPMEIYLHPDNIFVATFIGAPSMNILDARLFDGYVELEGCKLVMENGTPGQHRELPKTGLPVKLGIRPDFFIDRRHAGDGEALAVIHNARIDLIEPLGFDKELDVQIGSQLMKVRLDLRTQATEGDTIDLCVDMRRTHLFDIDTGQRLQ